MIRIAYNSFHSWPVRNQWLLLSCCFSLMLVTARVIYTAQPMFLFLVWNLFLGAIPFAISSLLLKRIHWIEDSKKFAAAFFFWLLFLPNAFYIITDLFHLEERPPMPLWFDLALIFSFAWNGLLLGALSLRQMEKVVVAKWPLRSPLLFLMPVSALCGLGVYIGRYLRYNSWDVVTAPASLIADLLYLLQHPLRNRIDWAMIGCYSTLLLLIYMCGRSVLKPESGN